MEQLPQNNNFQPMAHQIYYSNPSFGHYKPQVRNQYSEGIFIGKLSFIIKNEDVEENQYTGTEPLKTFSRQTDANREGNFDYYPKRKRYYSNNVGLNSSNFFIPEQHQQQPYQATAQPIKKEELDALTFLLGNQNPFVIRTQQLQQSEVKPQNESMKSLTNNKAAPTMQPLPLLEEVLHLKTPAVDPVPNDTKSDNPLSLNFILDKLPPLSSVNSKNECSEPCENAYWKTPEKRISFTDLSETLSTASSESMSKSDNRSSGEDVSIRRYSGKCQKKLRFKPHENGSHTSTAANSTENKTSNVKNQRPAGLFSFEMDNDELFPPLLEANKPSQGKH